LRNQALSIRPSKIFDGVESAVGIQDDAEGDFLPAEAKWRYVGAGVLL
jgi:hypothetical protein